MFALLLSAVRARFAQTATVLVLTALAVTAVVAGPWCAIASARTAASVDVAGATAGQRTVAVRETTGPTPDPRAVLAEFGQEIERTLTVPGERPTVGIRQSALTASRHGVPIAYRDQLCEHVRIAGACPSAPDEGILSTATAELLGLKIRPDHRTAPHRRRHRCAVSHRRPVRHARPGRRLLGRRPLPRGPEFQRRAAALRAPRGVRRAARDRADARLRRHAARCPPARRRRLRPRRPAPPDRLQLRRRTPAPGEFLDPPAPRRHSGRPARD